MHDTYRNAGSCLKFDCDKWMPHSHTQTVWFHNSNMLSALRFPMNQASKTFIRSFPCDELLELSPLQNIFFIFESNQNYSSLAFEIVKFENIKLCFGWQCLMVADSLITCLREITCFYCSHPSKRKSRCIFSFFFWLPEPNYYFQLFFFFHLICHQIVLQPNDCVSLLFHSQVCRYLCVELWMSHERVYCVEHGSQCNKHSFYACSLTVFTTYYCYDLNEHFVLGKKTWKWNCIDKNCLMVLAWMKGGLLCVCR